MKVTDLKTFEDACQVEGISPESVTVPTTIQENSNALLALAKLFIIVRAANRLSNNGEVWKADWNNTNEYKYFAWFYMGGSSGFRCVDCDVWLSTSVVGSRLCFKT